MIIAIKIRQQPGGGVGVGVGVEVPREVEVDVVPVVVVPAVVVVGSAALPAVRLLARSFPGGGAPIATLAILARLSWTMNCQIVFGWTT